MSLDLLFKNITGQKVLVIGDVMTDAYLWGKVERISPEAPVPIVAVNKKEKRLGGAANVALNVQALGAIPFLCGVVGNDYDGAEFADIMTMQRLKTDGIVKISGRKTTVKTRIIGNNHHLLRVDEEVVTPLNEKQSQQFIAKIISVIKKQKPAVIIFEDYDKGALNETVIKQVVDFANASGIKTTVDPKKNNFHHYKNVSLFKPNLSELKTGLKTEIDKVNIESLKKVCETFRRKNNIEMLMVTLSEHGVFYCSKTDAVLIPAHIRNISDVSGAGDTVISVASCCLAAGASQYDVAAIANLAGGLVCEEVGVVPVNKTVLKNELLRLKTLN